MKWVKISLLGMSSVLWIFILVGCDTEISWISSDLPDNDIISVLKNFDDEADADYSNIKEGNFEWYNVAEYDYEEHTNNGYYTITGYELALSWQNNLPNMNKILDGWHVFYVWDEIWWAAIQYSKDNILCSYFLSLEQDIPYELIDWNWDYDNEEEQAAYNQAWSDFYDVATYQIELSCGYAPEWMLAFKDFNINAEWMEPFWYASIRWDGINIFTPDWMDEWYIDVLKLDWDNINFKWYGVEWSLEKAQCVDGGKWDTHEYKISLDITKTVYWDNWIDYVEEPKHYEWCADKSELNFVPWEEWTLKEFIKKSGYDYKWSFDYDKVSYAIGSVIDRYMNVNIYQLDWEEYDNYQVIMEKVDDGWKVIYEWEWYGIGDEECERLNQYDNNLMDMFFLKGCPRG